MQRLGAAVCALALVVTAANDAEARRRRKKGTLALECSVAGARVSIDDKYAGRTPLKHQALREGSYTVKVKKLGYLDFSQTIEIKVGKTTSVAVDLLPYAGVIKVSANVRRATVHVDGKQIGRAPLEREVDIGKRQIRVRAPGYRDYVEEISADPGNLYTIKARLKKRVADDLALVPLAPGGGSSDDLALEALPSGDGDDVALAPLPGLAPIGDGGDNDLALEALPTRKPPPVKEIAAVDPALAPPGTEPGVGATVKPATPWYMEWWVWTAAGAVVVTGAVISYVVIDRGGGDKGTRTDFLWYPGDNAEPDHEIPAILRF